MQNEILDVKGKAQWSLLDEIPLEKISISLFLFLLACFIFFTDMLCGTPESLFIISYFPFLLLCGIHSFFFISLPVFPFFQFCFWHLAVTNNTFHWIFSFTCSVFLIFLISPFPSPPPYLLLTLAVPGNVTLVKIHFSHSLSPFFFSRSLTCFLHTPKFLSMILIN